MKKISKWSIAGMAVGLIFAVGSFWRYYVQAEDYNTIGMSYVVVTIAIGVLISAVAWLYNKQLSQGHTIEALEEYLVDKTNKAKE